MEGTGESSPALFIVNYRKKHWINQLFRYISYTSQYARVAESVDARDLKSLDRKVVPVQVRPRAPPFALWASSFAKATEDVVGWGFTPLVPILSLLPLQ